VWWSFEPVFTCKCKNFPARIKEYEECEEDDDVCDTFEREFRNFSIRFREVVSKRVKAKRDCKKNN